MPKKSKVQKLKEAVVWTREEHLEYKEEQLEKLNEIQLKLQTNDLQHSQITIHLTNISQKLDKLNTIKLNGDDLTLTLEEALHSIFAATKTLRVKKRLRETAKEYFEAHPIFKYFVTTKAGRSFIGLVIITLLSGLLHGLGITNLDPWVIAKEAFGLVFGGSQ